jgi:hypothetical protein
MPTKLVWSNQAYADLPEIYVMIGLEPLAGESFSPQKARILLALALARGRRPDQIAELFARC